MAFDLTTSLGGGGGGGPELTINSFGRPLQIPADSSYVLTSGAGGVEHAGSSLFWSEIDNQGAYITTNNGSSYIDVVNISGSGYLGWILSAFIANGNAAYTMTFRITIDGTSREIAVDETSNTRFLLVPTYEMLRLHHNNNTRGQGMFMFGNDADHIIFDNGYLILPPPGALQATRSIRFESSLRVEMKCTGSFYAVAQDQNTGVTYVID